MTIEQAGAASPIAPCVLRAARMAAEASRTAAAHRAMVGGDPRPTSFRQLAEAARTASLPKPSPWHFSLPYAALA